MTDGNALVHVDNVVEQEAVAVIADRIKPVPLQVDERTIRVNV